METTHSVLSLGKELPGVGERWRAGGTEMSAPGYAAETGEGPMGAGLRQPPLPSRSSDEATFSPGSTVR